MDIRNPNEIAVVVLSRHHGTKVRPPCAGFSVLTDEVKCEGLGRETATVGILQLAETIANAS